MQISATKFNFNVTILGGSGQTDLENKNIINNQCYLVSGFLFRLISLDQINIHFG